MMEENRAYKSPEIWPAFFEAESLVCLSGTIEDIGDLDEFIW